jgi:hypothetical protein
MTVAMKGLALLVKYSFTNKGCLQEALDTAIIDPSLIASACEKFCEVSSNCARRHFRSIHQFSAHEKCYEKRRRTMTPCNMMDYPMLEIFGSASPEVITTF